MYSFSYLEPVDCSMSSTNCCFLTCIQVSQEAGQVVWYSHLSQNFPQFIVIHTVKGFLTEHKSINKNFLVNHFSWWDLRLCIFLYLEIKTKTWSLTLDAVWEMFPEALVDCSHPGCPWGWACVWKRATQTQNRWLLHRESPLFEVFPKQVTHQEGWCHHCCPVSIKRMSETFYISSSFKKEREKIIILTRRWC